MEKIKKVIKPSVTSTTATLQNAALNPKISNNTANPKTPTNAVSENAVLNLQTPTNAVSENAVLNLQAPNNAVSDNNVLNLQTNSAASDKKTGTQSSLTANNGANSARQTATAVKKQTSAAENASKNSSYTQVGKGSSGSAVNTLQQILYLYGYDIDVDGVFGDQTLAAVKDYQQKNGLTVDGIVGDNTWGMLTANVPSERVTTSTTTTKPKEDTAGSKPTTNTTGTATNTDSGFKYDDFKYDDFKYDDFTYGDYTESEAVQQANALLQQHLNSKPGEYQSTWQGQIDSMIDKILNREKFSYDLNSDALYQQYKDQYTSLGKLAMQDTMGQAAAMTGGYGSSYASTAGNQAYQSYLSQLNDVVPELYGMALDRYNAEGSELYNQYSLLADQESQDYGRYMDAYNQYMKELDYLTGRYDSERSFDYGKYADDRAFAYGTYADDRAFDYGVYADDKNLAYNEYRNAIADKQWQQTFDEGVRQYNETMDYTKERDTVADKQWQDTFDYTKEQDAITNGLNADANRRQEESWEMQKSEWNDSQKSYSGTTESGVAYDNGNLTNGQVKELQAAYGVSADGYWGPESRKAAGGKTAEEAYAAKFGSGESTVPPMTDLEEINGWRDNILNAETQEDAAFYAELLEGAGQKTMADNLYKQWLRKNGLGVYQSSTRTTVGRTGGVSSGSLNSGILSGTQSTK